MVFFMLTFSVFFHCNQACSIRQLQGFNFPRKWMWILFLLLLITPSVIVNGESCTTRMMRNAVHACRISRRSPLARMQRNFMEDKKASGESKYQYTWKRKACSCGPFRRTQSWVRNLRVKCTKSKLSLSGGVDYTKEHRRIRRFRVKRGLLLSQQWFHRCCKGERKCTMDDLKKLCWHFSARTPGKIVWQKVNTRTSFVAPWWQRISKFKLFQVCCLAREHLKEIAFALARALSLFSLCRNQTTGKRQSFFTFLLK